MAQQFLLNEQIERERNSLKYLDYVLTSCPLLSKYNRPPESFSILLERIYKDGRFHNNSTKEEARYIKDRPIFRATRRKRNARLKEYKDGTRIQMMSQCYALPKEQALSLDRIQDGPCCVKLPNNFYMNVFEISNQNNKMNSGSKMPIHYLTTRKKDKDRHQLIKLHRR
jgi:hypothetical protein